MSIAQAVKIQELEQQVRDHAARLAVLEKQLRSLPPRSSHPIAEAAAFLREVLSEGARPTSEILSLAASRGIAERTLRRAKRDLGVGSQRPRPLLGRPQGIWLPPL